MIPWQAWHWPDPRPICAEFDALLELVEALPLHEASPDPPPIDCTEIWSPVAEAPHPERPVYIGLRWAARDLQGVA